MERITKLFSKYKQQENSSAKTESVDAISRIKNGEYNKILRGIRVLKASSSYGVSNANLPRGRNYADVMRDLQALLGAKIP